MQIQFNKQRHFSLNVPRKENVRS